MQRYELVEWIIIILCVLLWWPLIIWRFDPLWYHILLYYVEPIVLVVITARRWRRMKEGLQYSEQVAKSQQPPIPRP